MKALKKILIFSIFSLIANNITLAQTNPRLIEITGTDNMKFDVSSIEAKPGETLKIVLTTVSRIPKQAMAHNIVFLEMGTDVKAFANASAKARDNQYIAKVLKDKVIAFTSLAGGGETVEVIFTVPETLGEYEYICSFPGHYYGGMKGILIIN